MCRALQGNEVQRVGVRCKRVGVRCKDLLEKAVCTCNNSEIRGDEREHRQSSLVVG
jgi:hypothetical protein